VSGVDLKIISTANSTGFVFDLGSSAIAVPGSFVQATTGVPGVWSAWAVPETSTWIMMAIGFAGLGYFGRSAHALS
jgi:hypothetical protein